MDEPIKQPRGRATLPIISVVTFIGFLDTHLLLPVIALYASELRASPGIIGLIIGLYSITNTPANIFFGRLIDRVGYKLPLIAGLIGDAVSMFLYSVCRLPIHLALVRAIHGTSGALVGPATMSATADYSGRKEKGRVMGIYGIALATATLVGYGLSGVITSRLGYQALFLFGMAMLLIGAAVSTLLPKAVPKYNKTIKTLPTPAFTRVKDLLRRRGLIVAYCCIFAQYFSFGGVVTLLPLYVGSLEMEAFHVGMLLTTFAITFIIIQIPSGAFSDRAGRLLPTVLGLSLGVASLVILPSVVTFPMLAAAMALYGAAYGLLFPSISALVADHTVPEERGTATGVFHGLLTAGVAIGAPLIGWTGERVGVESGLALTSSALALALVIALIALGRRRIP